jgi:hypothetical protein
MATLPPVNYELIRLEGGLDQVTPTLSLPPGVVRRSANFEAALNGGYTRIAGYERHDGRPNPSDATYSVLVCTLTSGVQVGDTLTGVSSGASGLVIAISAGDMAITKLVGFHVTGEFVSVAGVTVGSVTSIVGGAADGYQDSLYRSLAANAYRADIGGVPGSGPVRGVAHFRGTVYAWRDNSAATAMAMYRASSAGWTAVDLMAYVEFNAGSIEILSGQTFVGATSGASALARVVVLRSGAWATSNATGYIVFSNRTGTPVANEGLLVAGVRRATSVGLPVTTTLRPGGRVSTVAANFGGGPANFKLYGCDGVNNAFEFSGETYVPIFTGMASDAPSQIAVHKQHLFLSFDYSLQFSAIGNPHVWSAVLGAGELSMNGTITNLLPLPGDQTSGALAVYTKNDTSILYGVSEADFKLSVFNSGTGAYPFTAQSMDQSYAFDDRGVMGLGTSLNFGNFVAASLTSKVMLFIRATRTLASASSVSRKKSQYRIFFSDQTALYLTIVNGKLIGIMPMQFDRPVLCCVEGESTDGNSVSYFGSSDGFVYRLDAGTSFDGRPIPANLNLVFNSIKSPRVLKRYRKASVEMTGDSFAQIAFGYDLGYRSQNIDQSIDTAHDSDLRSAYWDTMVWDNFVWDGADVTPTEVDMTGTAENLGIRISSVSDLIQPFTVNSLIIHYTQRRGLR